MADQQGDNVETRLADITFATRTPNSKDKGLFWVYDSGSTVAFYVRSKKSGSWILVGP